MPEPDSEQGHRWDSASAAEAGRKSAEVRAARARKAAEDPKAFLVGEVQRALPKLSADLLAAAAGEGEWSVLPPEKRLAALFKALEYGIGRPVPVNKVDGPAPAEEEPEEEGLLIT